MTTIEMDKAGTDHSNVRYVEAAARELCAAIAARRDMLERKRQAPYHYSPKRQAEIDQLQAEYHAVHALADRMESYARSAEVKTQG